MNTERNSNRKQKFINTERNSNRKRRKDEDNMENDLTSTKKNRKSK